MHLHGQATSSSCVLKIANFYCNEAHMQPRPLVTSIVVRPMGRPVAAVLLQEDISSRRSPQKRSWHEKDSIRYSHAEVERPHSKGVSLRRMRLCLAVCWLALTRLEHSTRLMHAWQETVNIVNVYGQWALLCTADKDSVDLQTITNHGTTSATLRLLAI